MPVSKNQYAQEEINQWDESEVAKWLIANKLEYLVEEFKSNQIDGQRLLVSIQPINIVINSLLLIIIANY